MIRTNHKKGIAILMAVIAVSAMLLIALSVTEIAYKEQTITYSGRDSKTAYYAANAGIECALFNDLGGGIDGAFTFTTPDTAGVGTLRCDGQDIGGEDVTSAGNAVTTTFYFNLPTAPDVPKSCSIVRVAKTRVATGLIETTIESRGYNNECESISKLSDNSNRNLERALLMKYCSTSANCAI